MERALATVAKWAREREISLPSRLIRHDDDDDAKKELTGRDEEKKSLPLFLEETYRHLLKNTKLPYSSGRARVLSSRQRVVGVVVVVDRFSPVTRSSLYHC